MTFYIIVLLVYLGADVIAVWGLNLQFGVTGVLNLAFIVEVAVGGYVYAMCTLGPSSGNGGFQRYIFGLNLPIPLAIVVAVGAGAGAGALFALIGLRKLRPDYQAITLLVVSVVATVVASADLGLVNGNAGLTLIPSPLGGTGPTGGWGYVLLVAVLCVPAYLIMRRVTDGPLGRSLRAVRDDPGASLAIGKKVGGLRVFVQALGGGYAGLSGALLVGYIGAWSPSSWQYVETLVLVTAVIVGGAGNNLGVMLGALLVPVLLLQGAQFLPAIAGRPGGAEDLGWIITGLLTIVFLWWRPRGLIPDRRPRYLRRQGRQLWGRRVKPSPDAPVSANVDEVLRVLVPERTETAERADDVTPAGDGSSILVVSGLEVSFGGLRAVDGASLTARRGAITGLIGPNGAGKSTLISAVSGFQPADTGRVEFDGIDISAWSPERRARRGLARTFQLSREFGRLTTLENLLVSPLGQRAESAKGLVLGRRHWGEEEERNLDHARSLLQIFEMADKADELAGNLSGGQKRMVEFMRALMTRPQMILLDEPIAGLSRRWSGLLEEATLELRRWGLSVVLVEHELGVIERLCDSVIVMTYGRVLTEGSMAELRLHEEVQAAYVIG